MRLSTQVRRALEGDRADELEQLVAQQPRVVRHLLGLTYQADVELRRRAAHWLGVAARHHPDLIQGLVRRLIWAMNDESGTNALTAPAVVRAIAEEQPRLLLPMVPDLTRLAADPGLCEGLGAALRVVADRCPGEVAKELQASLNERLGKGECHDC